MRTSGCLRLAAGGKVGLLVCVVAINIAYASPHQQWLTERVIGYGANNFDADSGLVKDTSGRPSVATVSPAYVLAALQADTDHQQAQTVLEAVLAHQDRVENSPTYGQFPWWPGEPMAPSRQATYLAVPLLAYIHTEYREVLPDNLQQQLGASLRRAWGTVQHPAASSDAIDIVLRAASLATLAAALDEPVGREQSLSEINRWLTVMANEGLTEGHSPTTDAYRIAALKWIWHSLASNERSVALQAALEFAYHDFAGRVQPGSGALAGAALYANPQDYRQGGHYSRYLIYADLGGPQPSEVDPFAMFFTIPDYTPPGDLILATTSPPPAQTTTTTGGGRRITRTDTYLHPLFSLGTMSGRPASTSIPLLMTFADGQDRPTAYFFTQPQANHISSVQKQNAGLITADFDNIGAGNRATAVLRGVLGPRSQIEQVYLAGQPWSGQPVAVAEMGKVAVQRIGCYVGLIVLRAGPAEAQQIISGPEPGVLRWASEDPEAELELLIYGRKRSYPLLKPQHNVRTGVVVEIQPASAFNTLGDFAQHLSQCRIRDRIERAKKLVSEPEDPYEAFLRKSDPKPKSELVYEYELIRTLQYTTEQTELRLAEEMLRGVVQWRQIDGEEVVHPGPWEQGPLLIPWGASPQSLLTRQQ